jgi:patatin-like phospholipase/acyl hydrolase
MANYNLLAMDGGGIRGILTARLLERIDEVLPGFLNNVALFGGTSTGGLIALGLASGMTPKEIREMYQTLGNRVFADTAIDNVKDLGHLVGAQYSIEPLKEVLTQFFSEKTLNDLNKKVVIATFDLDNEGNRPDGIRTWKMKFFQNYPGPGSDGEELVVDVGVRTSAAPSYFPVYQGYIDGGVAASNPAMCALAQALDRSTGGQNIQDVALLSLGTGRNPHYLPAQNADWGQAQWALHLITLMLEGDQDMVDFQCRQVLAEWYFRLNPILPYEIPMDSANSMPVLLATADQTDITAVTAWIQKYFQ